VGGHENPDDVLGRDAAVDAILADPLQDTGHRKPIREQDTVRRIRPSQAGRCSDSAVGY
jgi:hypothetical protein